MKDLRYCKVGRHHVERSGFTNKGLDNGICRACVKARNDTARTDRFKPSANDRAYTHILQAVRGKDKRLYKWCTLMGAYDASLFSIVYVVPSHGYVLPAAMARYDVLADKYILNSKKADDV